MKFLMALVLFVIPVGKNNISELTYQERCVGVFIITSNRPWEDMCGVVHYPPSSFGRVTI